VVLSKTASLETVADEKLTLINSVRVMILL